MKEKIMKFLVVFFMTLTFVNVLLPDEFVIGILKLPYRANAFEMIIRWFNFVGFITLPVAVFFKRDTFKKIAVYFCLPVLIIFTFMFPIMIKGFTSELGTGIVDMRILPEVVKLFMRNEMFRTIMFFSMVLSELLVIILLIASDKESLRFKKKEFGSFMLVLICLIVAIMPIYALETIFNTHTDLIFLRFSWMHLVWIGFLILEAITLCLIFRKRSEEDRYILVLVLSLCLLIQYNQLFSSLGEVSIERLPFMLCNVAAYVTCISIAFKNRGLYLFNILVNVVGGIIALIVLDVETPNGIMGMLSKDNIHYIVEHNNVILIPILCLVLRVFKPLKKEDIKTFVLYFSIYFIIAFAVGTIFNMLGKMYNDAEYYYCNYMYLFDQKTAAALIPITEPLFDIKFEIGYATFYPIVQPAIYLLFIVLGSGSLFLFKALVKDKNIIETDLN